MTYHLYGILIVFRPFIIKVFLANFFVLFVLFLM